MFGIPLALGVLELFMDIALPPFNPMMKSLLVGGTVLGGLALLFGQNGLRPAAPEVDRQNQMVDCVQKEAVVFHVRRVLSLFLGQGLKPTGIGIILGLLGALFAGRIHVSPRLAGISGVDPGLALRAE